MKKLIGIGVGPGDPELMTLKAIKNIQESDLIFIPVAKANQASVALKTAEKFITDQKIVPLIFPMIHSFKKRKTYMKKNVDIIKNRLSIFETGVFLTIGDPSVYATYMYIVALLQQESIIVETIPGISSFSAICARMNLPIALDTEGFLVHPLRKNDNHNGIKKIIDENENIIFMKITHGQEILHDVLKTNNYLNHTVLASNIGKSNEFVSKSVDALLKKDLSYFTTLIFKKGGINA